MPILVVCPQCGAKLNAPDSGAGKKVRCPKPNCGALIPVPAAAAAAAPSRPAPPPVPAAPASDFEFSPDDPKPKKAKAAAADEDDRPRKKSRDEDRDEDDRPKKNRRDDEGDEPRGKKRRDDDEDDRPRKRRRDDEEDEDDDRPRKKKQRKKGMSTGVLVGIIVGGLVVLGGAGYGIYALVSGGGPKSPPPAGWKEYTYKDAGFKAYFPSEPSVQDMGGLFAGAGGGNPFGGADVNVPQSIKMYNCLDFGGKAPNVAMVVVKFSKKISSADRSRALDEFHREKGRGGQTKSVRWMGESAEEVSGKEGVARVAFVGDTMYTAVIAAPMGGRPRPEEENGFFDNCQLVK